MLLCFGVQESVGEYCRPLLSLALFLFSLCRECLEGILSILFDAGVSAVPMAARVSQKVGAEADPTNFLLMHAMGPNVAGVIGTAVAAGTFMAIFGVF